MEGMRDLLRAGTLRRSLRGLQAKDRLAATWLVVCGKALANRSSVVGYGDAVVEIEVLEGWLDEVKSMKEHLKMELPRISGIPVSELHFIVKR